jgi:hypothetical protein
VLKILGREEEWMPEVELLSDVGANYTQLRDLLADGKWQEADEETRRVMLKVADRDNEGWLNEDSIRKLPCTYVLSIGFGLNTHKDALALAYKSASMRK